MPGKKLVLMNLGIIFNCNDASHICDKSQYAESTATERLLMKLHQWMCRICREHSAENSKLTEALHKAELKTLPEEDKAVLRRTIQQEISK
jgi:hypothetical protein